jgi:hypothetical protein
MCVRIPIPRGVGPGDSKRLRSHAARYLHQMNSWGPEKGSALRRSVDRRCAHLQEKSRIREKLS